LENDLRQGKEEIRGTGGNIELFYGLGPQLRIEQGERGRVELFSGSGPTSKMTRIN
jgi:hypothetical protein